MAALDGLVASRVGYCGGSEPEPTYRRVCNDKRWGDYVETIQLDYEPGRLSFEEVLDAFFRSHDPYARLRGRQYQSVIFAHSAEQTAMAEAGCAARSGVATVVEPFRCFWDAEAYHQKWLLQRRKELFMSVGLTDTSQLFTSQAATILNAFAARRVPAETCVARLRTLALEPEVERRVLAAVQAHTERVGF